MAIYTKRGDRGKTSLYTTKGKEKRVSKNSAKIRGLGAIDELNSFLGVARSFSEDKKITALIKDIQRNLLTIGSILAGSDLRFYAAKTKKLEKVIDELEGSLPVLSRFVLPGGAKLAAHLQYCRSLCRRAERTVVALSQKETVKPQILVYLNRLSDLLFMLARKANYDTQVKEDIWKGRKRLS